MKLESYGKNIYEKMVAFGNKNRICYILAVIVLFIGWGETAVPEDVSEVYPESVYKAAVLRLAAFILAVILILALCIGGIVHAVSKNNGKKQAEAVTVLEDEAKSGEGKKDKKAVSENSAGVYETSVSDNLLVEEEEAAQERTNTAGTGTAGTGAGTAGTGAGTGTAAAQTATYNEIILRFQNLKVWYDDIAKDAEAVDSHGCIKEKSLRNSFITDFEELEKQVKAQASAEEDIYGKLKQEDVYKRLLELYTWMKKYDDTEAENRLKAADKEKEEEEKEKEEEKNKILTAGKPECRSAADAGGFYYVYANGTPITVSADGTGTKIAWNGGTYTYTASCQSNVIIYGGYESDALNGNTSVTMTGGTVRAIYGGGNWLEGDSRAMVSGETMLDISGGMVAGDVYGGGNNSNASAGGTNIKITGGEIAGSVYGGGMQGKVTGTVSVTIGGNAVIGTAGDASTGFVDAEGYTGTVAGTRSVRVQGEPQIRGGIRMDSVTGKKITITGTLTGEPGTMRLQFLSLPANGTIVADASDTGYLNVKPFELAGSQLAVLGVQIKVANVYTLTLDADGGTDGDPSILAQYSMQLPAGIRIPVKDNYTFNGYFTEKNGKGTQYYDASGKRVYEDVWSGNKEITLYASWNQNRAALLINPNGGIWNGTDQVQSFEQDAGTILELPDPQKENFLFAGWEEKGKGGIVAGNTYHFGPEEGSMELAARWIENENLSCSSSVEINSNVVTAGNGLNRLFGEITEDGTAGVTKADMQPGNQVELKMTIADSSDQAEGAAQIAEVSQDEELCFLDIAVEKTVIRKDSTTDTVRLAEIPASVQICIELTGRMAEKDIFKVYRFHDGAVDTIAYGAPGVEGEYYSFLKGTGVDGGDQIILHTRKFSAYALGGSENEAVIESVDGSISADVYGKVVDGSDAIYKIDILWGAMQFEYAAGNQWDADTHSYQPGEDSGWLPNGFDGVNNKITVVNHSNSDLKMGFSVGSSILTGVDMKLTETNAPAGEGAAAPLSILLEKVPSQGAAAPQKEVYLQISGKPDTAETLSGGAFKKAAVITVTAQPVEENGLTPKNAGTP